MSRRVFTASPFAFRTGHLSPSAWNHVFSHSLSIPSGRRGYLDVLELYAHEPARNGGFTFCVSSGYNRMCDFKITHAKRPGSSEGKSGPFVWAGRQFNSGPGHHGGVAERFKAGDL